MTKSAFPLVVQSEETDEMTTADKTRPAPLTDWQREIATVLVQAVKLRRPPEAIDPQEPLFGDQGLELDSIDALELSLELSKRYGIQIQADQAESQEIFRNLNQLSLYVAQNRTR